MLVDSNMSFQASAQPRQGLWTYIADISIFPKRGRSMQAKRSGASRWTGRGGETQCGDQRPRQTTVQLYEAVKGEAFMLWVKF
jgi:hypothetical protein